MVLPVPLQRPVWDALAGRQSSFAVGGPLAWRFDPEVSPFGAAANGSAASLAALTELAGDDELWLVETAAQSAPPGLVVARQSECVQMVADVLTPAGTFPGIEPLTDDDALEMRGLALLTEPGPFLPRTHELGDFVGIRHAGRLVAMAGERMRPPGFTEVSGVCTHPDHRGKGYAGALMRVVAAAILARRERPYLHAYASNTGAIALYEKLGFRVTAIMTATVLRRAP